MLNLEKGRDDAYPEYSWDVRRSNMDDFDVIEGGSSPKQPEDKMKTVESFVKKNPRKLVGGIIILLLLAWGSSGFYTLNAGEQGVVTTFGKFSAIATPGLRYRLPRPIQNHHKVDIATIRRAEIGFRTGMSGVITQEALMLTGDENIVEVNLFVQYRVSDPKAFVFNVKEPETTLHSTTEVALRSIVGQNPIDYTMTEGRVDVQEAVQVYIQELLDSYGTGIMLMDVRLLAVDPPEQVKDSFDEVVRAWEDRERLVQEAEGYMEDLLPRARGEAEALVREAEGYRERRILRAQGDVAMFISVLDEYEKSKEVTRERLYLEAMMEILPQTTRFILDEKTGSGIVPLLPLTDSLDI